MRELWARLRDGFTSIWARISKAFRGLPARFRAGLSRHRLELGIIALVILIVFVYLVPDIFIPIRPGEGGVLWKRFAGGIALTEDRSKRGEETILFRWFGLRGGTVTDKVYTEGIQIIFPWDKMYVYNIRLQEEHKEYDALSKQGLNIEVVISVRYRPMLEQLGSLHKNVGPDYVRTLLMPEIGDIARREISKYTAEELYTGRREEIRDAILQRMKQEAPVIHRPGVPSSAFLYIENIFIRKITLPKKVAESIQNKIVQLQLVEEYKFRIQKEVLEKRRKEIEAEGIALFNEKVGKGISEKYLRWKGIDATLSLAESNNSKVVIIGAGTDGLPIILGPIDTQARASTAPKSSPNVYPPDYPLPDDTIFQQAYPQVKPPAAGENESTHPTLGRQ